MVGGAIGGGGGFSAFYPKFATSHYFGRNLWQKKIYKNVEYSAFFLLHMEVCIPPSKPFTVRFNYPLKDTPYCMYSMSKLTILLEK